MARRMTEEDLLDPGSDPFEDVPDLRLGEAEEIAEEEMKSIQPFLIAAATLNSGYTATDRNSEDLHEKVVDDAFDLMDKAKVVTRLRALLKVQKIKLELSEEQERAEKNRRAFKEYDDL